MVPQISHRYSRIVVIVEYSCCRFRNSLHPGCSISAIVRECSRLLLLPAATARLVNVVEHFKIGRRAALVPPNKIDLQHFSCSGPGRLPDHFC